MSVTLKPLNQQVLFITGATSHLGLSTLHAALASGAKVFMVSKKESELEKIQNEMRLKKLPTAYAVADLSEIDQLQVAADQCLDTFGAIDTWINFSGMTDRTVREFFDDSFWGVVNGSKVAVDILSKNGGALINVANNLSENSLDVAFKQAVKGYTDTLRKELLKQKAKLSISFITIEEKRRLEAPAETSSMILKCAENSKRELKITSPSAIENMILKIRSRDKDLIVANVPKKNLLNDVSSFFSRD